ncbi:hypothetical protein HK097_010539 [Rhizophlyctis rosea]|uniref:CARP motif domain-containing protein n=1 Tax=Rhizophlyctis rosea TaxID=64517 RepID=A0AAD5S9R7_9FUNG|nr:hypothetical protein HK097_010539 [Rhizophlyctis rosea]
MPFYPRSKSLQILSKPTPPSTDSSISLELPTHRSKPSLLTRISTLVTSFLHTNTSTPDIASAAEQSTSSPSSGNGTTTAAPVSGAEVVDMMRVSVWGRTFDPTIAETATKEAATTTTKNAAPSPDVVVNAVAMEEGVVGVTASTTAANLIAETAAPSTITTTTAAATPTPSDDTTPTIMHTVTDMIIPSHTAANASSAIPPSSPPPTSPTTNRSRYNPHLCHLLPRNEPTPQPSKNVPFPPKTKTQPNPHAPLPVYISSLFKSPYPASYEPTPAERVEWDLMDRTFVNLHKTSAIKLPKDQYDQANVAMDVIRTWSESLRKNEEPMDVVATVDAAVCATKNDVKMKERVLPSRVDGKKVHVSPDLEEVGETFKPGAFPMKEPVEKQQEVKTGTKKTSLKKKIVQHVKGLFRKKEVKGWKEGSAQVVRGRENVKPVEEVRDSKEGRKEVNKKLWYFDEGAWRLKSRDKSQGKGANEMMVNSVSAMEPHEGVDEEVEVMEENGKDLPGLAKGGEEVPVEKDLPKPDHEYEYFGVFRIDNFSRCQLFVHDLTHRIIITNCHKTTMYLGPCSGTVEITNCRDHILERSALHPLINSWYDVRDLTSRNDGRANWAVTTMEERMSAEKAGHRDGCPPIHSTIIDMFERADLYIPVTQGVQKRGSGKTPLIRTDVIVYDPKLDSPRLPRTLRAVASHHHVLYSLEFSHPSSHDTAEYLCQFLSLSQIGDEWPIYARDYEKMIDNDFEVERGVVDREWDWCEVDIGKGAYFVSLGNVAGKKEGEEAAETFYIPSDAFLAWCCAALQPLERSTASAISTDEFLTLLLSLPMADSATMQMICDDTLGGITAIDSRRFGVEFFKRRREDAGEGGGGWRL